MTNADGYLQVNAVISFALLVSMITHYKGGFVSGRGHIINMDIAKTLKKAQTTCKGGSVT